MSFGGYNPARGQDAGPLPPGAGGQVQQYAQYPASNPTYYAQGIYSAPQLAAAGTTAHYTGSYLPSSYGIATNPFPSYNTLVPGNFVTSYGNPYGQAVAYTPGVTPTPQQLPTWATNQPQGQGGYLRWPTTAATIDPCLPAAQMTNSTGGVGCEPGYNYFFPKDHTKIHIIKSPIPPWQLPPNAKPPFHAVHVPCIITLAELLKGFGCNSPVPSKNAVYEVVSAGGGRWYKGISFTGDMKDVMKKSIREVGWDETRTGQPGQKAIVCLYFTKD